MKLRNLVLLSSLVLIASCVTRSKPKGGAQEGQKTDIKFSMASSLSEIVIPADAPPEWSMIGKCESGYDLKLNRDNRQVRLNDKCSFSLQSIGPIDSKTAENAPVEKRTFIRHRTEKEYDKSEHPIFFLSTDNKLGFWARLTTDKALDPIKEDSNISYIITSISQGKELTAQLDQLELEQLSFKGMEPPRFAPARIVEQSLEHNTIKGRIDLQCIGDGAFTLVAPDANRKDIFTAAGRSLHTFAKKAKDAREKLHASSKKLKEKAADAMDAVKATQVAIDAIAPFPASPEQQQALTDLMNNISGAGLAPDDWVGLTVDEMKKKLRDLTGNVRRIIVDHAAAKQDPITKCENPAGDRKLQPQSAQQMLEKCLNTIKTMLSDAANKAGVDNWKCGTNSLANISYRLSSDTHHGSYGQLTISDLDQMMVGVPMCADPANKNTIVHPQEQCKAHKINETIDGFYTVFVNPSIAHHAMHTSSLLVMKAEGPVVQDKPRDYSFSYFKVQWKNFQH